MLSSVNARGCARHARAWPGLVWARTAACTAGLWIGVACAGDGISAPEVARAPAVAQADGQEHTLRQIPEACVRLQGRFTGTQPAYALEAVPTRPDCQPRARFDGLVEARPESGPWRINDVIRVPSATCPGLAAVLTVWRRPGEGGALALDAQGRARIVLRDAMQGRVAEAAPTHYAATLAVEGAACGR